LGLFWHAATLSAQDVIISVTTPPYIVNAGLLHKFLHRRTRVILWYMDIYPDIMEVTGLIKKGSLISRFLRALNRFDFRHIDHLISLDAAMQDRLLSQYAAADGKPTHSIIPTWERVEDFPNTSSNANLIPHGPFTKDNPLVIIYTGNAGWGHDFEPVIGAAKELQEQPVAFHFTGGGKQTAWIKDQITKDNLANIHMHGFLPHQQLCHWLSKAHLSLITLRYDCSGIMSPSKLHSYLAMGLPVIYIGPPNTNVETAISKAKCGFTISPGDSKALVNTVLSCLHNPDIIPDLSRNASAIFISTDSSIPCFRDFNFIIN
jgi:glycosyltransferase involved in cell wall biosynthesis